MDKLLTIAACISCGVLFYAATGKTLGVMQQCGYQNARFFKWLKRKDNLLFNRLSLLSGMLMLFCALTVLAFSPLGLTTAKLVSAVPFLVLCLCYIVADAKYALKVKTKRTDRLTRLSAMYLFVVFCFEYLFLTALYYIGELLSGTLYYPFAFVPFALTPLALPFLLAFANACTGVFENARNKKFVKRAGQVLDETQIVRICVTGSYGKTSVKNALCAMLSKRFDAVCTPESYNTPIGIAKTVFSKEFAGKKIFIAEAGARKVGDIAELCEIVKPDYAIFTGVCAQHIESFGSVEEVFKGKSEVVYATKEAVYCGASLKDNLAALPEEQRQKCVVVETPEHAEYFADKTRFTLALGEEKVEICTALLGRAAVENIALAAALAYRLGVPTQEIKEAAEELTPVPHRLQLIQSGGVYILDDGYNCNERGAQEAVEALKRFDGKKTVVTPGIVEAGILEEELSKTLGASFVGLDDIVLVGDTLVGALKEGYLAAGGEKDKIRVFPTLSKAQEYLSGSLQAGDAVLFLNDLPDAY